MSTIVGLKDGKNVWIGSDGKVTLTNDSVRPYNMKKFFKNGKCVIGHVGSVRGGQILMPEYGFEPPQDIYQMADAIRLQCTALGCITMADDGSQQTSCNYLVIYKKGLYEILSNFQLNIVENYTSIGAGSFFAIASLFTTEKMNIQPKDRIQLALEAASNFDVSTGPPFYIEKF